MNISVLPSWWGAQYLNAPMSPLQANRAYVHGWVSVLWKAALVFVGWAWCQWNWPFAHSHGIPLDKWLAYSVVLVAGAWTFSQAVRLMAFQWSHHRGVDREHPIVLLMATLSVLTACLGGPWIALLIAAIAWIPTEKSILDHDVKP
jgi:hypothetical protein